jgi:hypothetical protein
MEMTTTTATEEATRQLREERYNHFVKCVKHEMSNIDILSKKLQDAQDRLKGMEFTD